MSPAFAVRGVIEGFYGVFYTHPERLSLLEFLARHGYNQYVYAPKNDREHRRRWREPYPARQMAEFGEAIELAGSLGIDFVYSLSPGIDICYSSSEDFEHLTGKLRSFYDLGVRDFALLLDDIRRTFPDARDLERYESFAQAQADLCNRVYEWLIDLDPQCTLSMCPTEYHGGPPFSASLVELGALLHRGIDVYYTGVEVCSATVGEAETEAFAAVLGRRPILWDNYPVNDLAMHSELHIGPLLGRSRGLGNTLRGVVVNPMNQPEASKVVLATYGDYLRDPHGYEPDASWLAAMREVAGEHADEFRLVAQTSLKSCLGTPEAERLAMLTAAALAALERAQSSSSAAVEPVVDELFDYLVDLDEAAYALRYRLENLALRNELVPWLELLEQWSWLGRWSIEALRDSLAGVSVEPGLLRRIEEYIGLTGNHHKRIAGSYLLPLAQLALERARAREVA